MAKAIKIPSLGTAVDEVTVLEWLKNEGDMVKRGEPLCEVETDKAVTQLESVAEGVLLKQAVAADTKVQEGTIVAWIGRSGEEIPETTAPPPSAAPTTRPRAQAAPVASRPSATPPIAPLIRNLAKKMGIDLSAVKGTGPGGRITRNDLQQFEDRQAASPHLAALSRMQQAVARRVSKSHREMPPIHLICPIDMSAVIAKRSALKDASGKKVAFDSLFMVAVSRVIKEFPRFLSHLAEDEVTGGDHAHIGFAVAVGDDLVIPVVQDADQKSLLELETEIRALTDKARKGSIQPQEMSDAVFTISNLGMYPVESFTLIIPPGQSAGLTIGAIQEVPSVRNAEVVMVPQVKVTLAVDHRVINGSEAGVFLQKLKHVLEEIDKHEI